MWRAWNGVCIVRYGASRETIKRMLDDLGLKDPVVLSDWDSSQMRSLVDTFVKLRFPMVLLLNKADQGGETDRHIQRTVEKFDVSGTCPCVVGSAAAEVFLKAAKKKRYIRYLEGSDYFTTAKDEEEDSLVMNTQVPF